MPKLLFYLGDSSPSTSLTVLQLLHNAARYCTATDVVSQAVDGLQMEMYPLFCRPGIKGSSRHAAELSTFAMLPRDCQVCCGCSTEC